MMVEAALNKKLINFGLKLGTILSIGGESATSYEAGSLLTTKNNLVPKSYPSSSKVYRVDR